MNLIACSLYIVYVSTSGGFFAQHGAELTENFDGSGCIAVSGKGHGERFVINVELFCQDHDGASPVVIEVKHFFETYFPEGLKAGFFLRCIGVCH